MVAKLLSLFGPPEAAAERCAAAAAAAAVERLLLEAEPLGGGGGYRHTQRGWRRGRAAGAAARRRGRGVWRRRTRSSRHLVRRRRRRLRVTRRRTTAARCGRRRGRGWRVHRGEGGGNGSGAGEVRARGAGLKEGSPGKVLAAARPAGDVDTAAAAWTAAFATGDTGTEPARRRRPQAPSGPRARSRIRSLAPLLQSRRRPGGRGASAAGAGDGGEGRVGGAERGAARGPERMPCSSRPYSSPRLGLLSFGAARGAARCAALARAPPPAAAADGWWGSTQPSLVLPLLSQTAHSLLASSHAVSLVNNSPSVSAGASVCGRERARGAQARAPLRRRVTAGLGPRDVGGAGVGSAAESIK